MPGGGGKGEKASRRGEARGEPRKGKKERRPRIKSDKKEKPGAAMQKKKRGKKARLRKGVCAKKGEERTLTRRENQSIAGRAISKEKKRRGRVGGRVCWRWRIEKSESDKVKQPKDEVRRGLGHGRQEEERAPRKGLWGLREHRRWGTRLAGGGKKKGNKRSARRQQRLWGRVGMGVERREDVGQGAGGEGAMTANRGEIHFLL